MFPKELFKYASIINWQLNYKSILWLHLISDCIGIYASNFKEYGKRRIWEGEPNAPSMSYPGTPM